MPFCLLYASTVLKKKDRIIDDLRNDVTRLREQAKSAMDPDQILQHPEYLALRRTLVKLESTPNPECSLKYANLSDELRSIKACSEEIHRELRSSRRECEVI